MLLGGQLTILLKEVTICRRLILTVEKRTSRHSYWYKVPSPSTLTGDGAGQGRTQRCWDSNELYICAALGLANNTFSILTPPPGILEFKEYGMYFQAGEQSLGTLVTTRTDKTTGQEFGTCHSYFLIYFIHFLLENILLKSTQK